MRVSQPDQLPPPTPASVSAHDYGQCYPAQGLLTGSPSTWRQLYRDPEEAEHSLWKRTASKNSLKQHFFKKKKAEAQSQDLKIRMTETTEKSEYQKCQRHNANEK